MPTGRKGVKGSAGVWRKRLPKVNQSGKSHDSAEFSRNLETPD